MSKGSVSLDDIKCALKSNACVILLVNAIRLNGVDFNFDYKNDDIVEVCSNNQSLMNKFLARAINILKPTTYCGHFIVLVGFDERNSVFFYLNPSTNKNLSFTMESDLEIARKCFGTDEDIVFVYI